MPQHHSWLKLRTQENIFFIFSSVGITSVLWIIVLLHHQTSVKLEVMNCCPSIRPWYFNNGKVSRPWGSKEAQLERDFGFGVPLLYIFARKCNIIFNCPQKQCGSSKLPISGKRKTFFFGAFSSCNVFFSALGIDAWFTLSNLSWEEQIS